MAQQRLDVRAPASDLSAEGIMAEAEQRLQSPQSPGSGKASVPADWQRRPSNHQAKSSFEDTASRTRMRDSKQIYPDNASLARAGRQFTVGNIGNNGRIYLRYEASPILRQTLLLTITADQLYVRALNAQDLLLHHFSSLLEPP